MIFYLQVTTEVFNKSSLFQNHSIIFHFLVTGHIFDSIDPKIIVFRYYATAVSPIETSF